MYSVPIILCFWFEVSKENTKGLYSYDDLKIRVIYQSQLSTAIAINCLIATFLPLGQPPPPPPTFIAFFLCAHFCVIYIYFYHYIYGKKKKKNWVLERSQCGPHTFNVKHCIYVHNLYQLVLYATITTT